MLVAALRRVLEAGTDAGLPPLGAAKLALRPRHGVSEFFVHLSNNSGRTPWAYNETELSAIILGPGIGSKTDNFEAFGEDDLCVGYVE